MKSIHIFLSIFGSLIYALNGHAVDLAAIEQDKVAPGSPLVLTTAEITSVQRKIMFVFAMLDGAQTTVWEALNRPRFNFCPLDETGTAFLFSFGCATDEVIGADNRAQFITAVNNSIKRVPLDKLLTRTTYWTDETDHIPPFQEMSRLAWIRILSLHDRISRLVFRLNFLQSASSEDIQKSVLFLLNFDRRAFKKVHPGIRAFIALSLVDIVKAAKLESSDTARRTLDEPNLVDDNLSIQQLYDHEHGANKRISNEINVNIAKQLLGPNSSRDFCLAHESYSWLHTYENSPVKVHIESLAE